MRRRRIALSQEALLDVLAQRRLADARRPVNKDQSRAGWLLDRTPQRRVRLCKQRVRDGVVLKIPGSGSHQGERMTGIVTMNKET